MKNKDIYFLLTFFILSSSIGNAPAVHAAEVYFAPHTERIYVDDTFVIETKISSPYELINVADGAFLFDKNILEVQEISKGGSVFSLWASEPSFSNIEGSVSFVGGVPEGFQGAEGLILKTIFRAKQAGEITFTFKKGFSLLLSDGKGTLAVPKVNSLLLTVGTRPPDKKPKDEWNDLITGDVTPPKFIEAIISKDNQFFENRYFANFFATDEASGVSYYEVKEGGQEFVRAVSPYVLQDQTLKGVVQIRVVDSAGNETVKTLSQPTTPQIPFYKTILFWILVIVFLLSARFLMSKRKIKNET